MRIALLTACAALTGTVGAAPPEHWQPVDQAVADLDQLSTSLRRIESGLRSDGEQTSLYRVTDDSTVAAASPVYYRVGPGFRARLHRIDYVVPVSRRSARMNVTPRRDGQFFELIAADTVFDLRPRPTNASPPSPPAPDYRIDARIDGRIDGRVDGHVDGRAP